MADRGAIENYFKLLKEVLDEHALLEKPAQCQHQQVQPLPGASASTNSDASSTSTSAATAINNGECCECFETYEDNIHFGCGEKWMDRVCM